MQNNIEMSYYKFELYAIDGFTRTKSTKINIMFINMSFMKMNDYYFMLQMD